VISTFWPAPLAAIKPCTKSSIAGALFALSLIYLMPIFKLLDLAFFSTPSAQIQCAKSSAIGDNYLEALLLNCAHCW
jgi:hypothetical protein